MAPITVFGAGIFGLSVAWSLKRRGAAVTVIDPGGPAAGASGGIVGALAPHVPEAWNAKKAFQFESLCLAERMWDEVAEIADADPGYARLGRVQPLPDDAAVALAQDRARSAETLWQGRFRWTVLTMAETGLAARSPTGMAVQDDLTARIHPRRATQALAKALTRLGVTFDTAAPPAGGVQVWATGAAGLETLSRELGRPVGAPIKGQAALLGADLRDRPQLFADGVHIVPHGDGTTAIGSTTEREFADASATDAQLDDVIARACAALPELADAPVLDRWAGLRPRARSRAPMLGPHPTRDDVYIANGGFKIGFGMAPLAGEVLARLILEGEDEIPPEFRVEASL